MNYYYSAKKSKHKPAIKSLWLNITIIVAILVLCVSFGLIFGNKLKDKADNSIASDAPDSETTFEESIPEDKESDKTVYTKNNRTAEEMSGFEGFLDLEGCTDIKDAKAFVDNAYNAGYTGIYFEAVDGNGKITYSSDAVSELVGGTVIGLSTDGEILSAAISRAKADGMRITSYINAGDVLSVDESGTVGTAVGKRITAELYGFGVDEFILDGIISEENFTTDDVKGIYSFIHSLRKSCPEADFGIVLPVSVFENPTLTPTVELMFGYSDFFVIDFKNTDIQTVKNIYDNCIGSFKAYNMRVLASASSVDEIQNLFEMYNSIGLTSVSFATPIEKYEIVKDDDGKEKYLSKVFSYSLAKSDDETKDEDR